MKQLLFCASLMIAFASCKKSSTSAVENNEILRSGNWRMKAFTVKFEKTPGVDSVYDIFKKFDTCRSDDYITFGENFKGIQFSSKLKCGGELDETPFEWELRNNQKVLMLNNAQYTIGNVSEIPITPTGKDYVEATISKINKKSFTINYSTTAQVYGSLFPVSDTGVFVEKTFYFTQTFEK